MPYTNEFVNFYSGYQFNFNNAPEPKDAVDNDSVAFFFSTPITSGLSYQNDTTEFISSLEVNIDRVPVTYTETFTEWNDTDNFSRIIFNFDSIIIPANGVDTSFNGVEIISPTRGNIGETEKTIELTRIADHVSGFAQYTTVPANIIFTLGYRLYHPTSSVTHRHVLDETFVGNFVTIPISGVAIGETITMRNGNYFTIARFVYDREIILPSDSGLNFDVGALEVTFNNSLQFC